MPEKNRFQEALKSLTVYGFDSLIKTRGGEQGMENKGVEKNTLPLNLGANNSYIHHNDFVHCMRHM